MSDEPIVEIHVRPNGSLKVYGPARVLDVDGNPYDLAPEDGRQARRAHQALPMRTVGDHAVLRRFPRRHGVHLRAEGG